MKTLLQINASLLGTAGESSQLAERFAEQWLATHSNGRVIKRDVAREAVPHLTAERFGAFGTKPDERTREQSEVVAYSDALIDELNAADVITIAAPMYNFSIPSTLRAYFDHVARAGVTFRYTANGPEGLLKDKKVYVFITRGGVYPDAADTQTPYLKQFLGFIGLKDVEFVYAEGLGMGGDVRAQGLAKAHDAIAQFVPVARAA